MWVWFFLKNEEDAKIKYIAINWNSTYYDAMHHDILTQVDKPMRHIMRWLILVGKG